jgi:bifunctional DNA-binding transcriptional regulator/antitoxin component of YhaV-PrlF toxin-antitoxin module
MFLLQLAQLLVVSFVALSFRHVNMLGRHAFTLSGSCGQFAHSISIPLVGNEYLNYRVICFCRRNFLVTSLTVTMKGQVTLKRDLLQHLGIKPGERIDFDKLPNGELRVKAARPTGTIDKFIGRHAGKAKKPLTIEDMNEIAASGWAGEE